MKIQKIYKVFVIVFIILLIVIGSLYSKSQNPFDIYKTYGIVYDEKTGKLLYKGNKVFEFYDRITDDISCFYLDENGTIMVEVMRNKKGILTGVKTEIVK